MANTELTCAVDRSHAHTQGCHHSAFGVVGESDVPVWRPSWGICLPHPQQGYVLHPSVPCCLPRYSAFPSGLRCTPQIHPLGPSGRPSPSGSPRTPTPRRKYLIPATPLPAESSSGGLFQTWVTSHQGPGPWDPGDARPPVDSQIWEVGCIMGGQLLRFSRLMSRKRAGGAGAVGRGACWLHTGSAPHSDAASAHEHSLWGN